MSDHIPSAAKCTEEPESRMNAFTDGEAYERLMGRWSRQVGAQFLDWLDLPKGLQCLDVGCGKVRSPKCWQHR